MPRLLNHACGTPPIMKLRAKLVPNAAGKVLELGIGSGRDLSFYVKRPRCCGSAS